MSLIQVSNLTFAYDGSRQVGKDSRKAAQGVQPLVRNEVTQNSPDIQVSGLLPRRAHNTGSQTHV